MQCRAEIFLCNCRIAFLTFQLGSDLVCSLFDVCREVLQLLFSLWGKGKEQSENLGGTPSPESPEAALTLIRVGGSKDGAVLFLHLLHILRQFLDAASDLFHLGQETSDTSPRESGQPVSAQRNGLNPEGQGVCRKEGVHMAKEVVGKGQVMGRGVGSPTCSKNSSIKWSPSTWTTSSSSSLSFAWKAKQGQIHEQSVPCSPRLTLLFSGPLPATHTWMVPVLGSETREGS